MNIGKLLQLQRSFQRDGKMNPAGQEQEIVLAEKTFGKVFDVLRMFQNAFHLLRQFGEIRQCLANLRIGQRLVEVGQVKRDEI